MFLLIKDVIDISKIHNNVKQKKKKCEKKLVSFDNLIYFIAPLVTDGMPKIPLNTLKLDWNKSLIK